MKRILLIILGIIFIGCNIAMNTTFAVVPSFENNFSAYLLGEKVEKWESVWNLTEKLGIKKELSPKENIKRIFYPDSTGQGGTLRDIIKNLGLVVLVVMIVIQGIQYVMHADEPWSAEKFHSNFIYIFLGSVIFFWATWILGIGLNLWGDGGSSGLLTRLDQGLMFQIFSGLRALAFFAAIILLIFTGWKIMTAMDKKDKYSAATRWILNIVVSLILIKLIDYIYFIAQTPDLKSKATELIVEVSKALGYILGGFFTIMIIYYGFRLMFGGSEDHLKKVKNIIVAVFLGSLVLFVFFLIIYQITQEFT